VRSQAPLRGLLSRREAKTPVQGCQCLLPKPPVRQAGIRPQRRREQKKCRNRLRCIDLCELYDTRFATFAGSGWSIDQSGTIRKCIWDPV